MVRNQINFLLSLLESLEADLKQTAMSPAERKMIAKGSPSVFSPLLMKNVEPAWIPNKLPGRSMLLQLS